MSEILFRNSVLIIEFVKLFLVVCGVLEYPIKSKWYTATLVVIAMCITSALAGVVHIDAFNFFIGVACIILVALSVVGKKKSIYSLLSYTAICVVDLTLVAVPLFIMNIGREQLHEDNYIMLGINSMSVIVIFIILIFKLARKKKVFDITQNIKTRQLLACFIGLFACLLYMTPLVLDQSFINSTNLIRNVFTLSLTISGLVFMGIYVALIISNNTKKHLEEILDLKNKYDKMMLSKNDEIRAFKHDIRDKLYCMQLLLDDEKYVELHKSLNELNAVIPSFEIKIQTGNRLLNAIANSLLDDYKDNNITVDWKGQLPEEINISALDMSAIFFNLLRNAFEATALCEPEKNISVVVQTLNTDIFVTIKNTFTNNLTVVDGEINTSKIDKKNHGYGLRNVDNCVKKYNGIVEYSHDNTCFTVEMILRNVL